jgi:hypothetical protein
MNYICVLSDISLFLLISDYHGSAANDVAADGMIIFPAFGVFSGLGGMGVSMFFVSCVVSIVENHHF